jgi:hypothetical protein
MEAHRERPVRSRMSADVNGFQSGLMRTCLNDHGLARPKVAPLDRQREIRRDDDAWPLSGADAPDLCASGDCQTGEEARSGVQRASSHRLILSLDDQERVHVDPRMPGGAEHLQQQ